MRMHLRNIQSHENTVLPILPGVINIIKAENETGKSVPNKCLKFLAKGSKVLGADERKVLIRRECDEALFAIEMDDGTILGVRLYKTFETYFFNNQEWTQNYPPTEIVMFMGFLGTGNIFLNVLSSRGQRFLLDDDLTRNGQLLENVLYTTNLKIMRERAEEYLPVAREISLGLKHKILYRKNDYDKLVFRNTNPMKESKEVLDRIHTNYKDAYSLNECMKDMSTYSYTSSNLLYSLDDLLAKLKVRNEIKKTIDTDNLGNKQNSFLVNSLLSELVSKMNNVLNEQSLTSLGDIQNKVILSKIKESDLSELSYDISLNNIIPLEEILKKTVPNTSVIDTINEIKPTLNINTLYSIFIKSTIQKEKSKLALDTVLTKTQLSELDFLVKKKQISSSLASIKINKIPDLSLVETKLSKAKNTQTQVNLLLNLNKQLNKIDLNLINNLIEDKFKVCPLCKSIMKKEVDK